MSQAPDDSGGDGVGDAPSVEDDGSSERSLDDEFEALAASRRRRALYVLSRTDDSTTLADLADAVASLPDDDGDPEEVAASLHHVHLPKLAALDVVDYDADDDAVEAVGDSDRLCRLLSLTAANERRSLRRALDESTGA
jgi:hypothetical protein